MFEMSFFVISAFNIIRHVVLPTYTPPLNVERVDLIERYFQLGLGYSEILLFLESLHGCFLSLRQLKWMLKQEGLARLLNTILFDELR